MVLLRPLNGERSARGLAAMKPQAGLRQIAREWSVNMANTHQLAHRPDLAAQVQSRVTGNWQLIGENVGVGGSVATLHQAFMNSPGHYANVVGNYNYVGIGTELRNGTLWVTFNFLRSPESLAVVTSSVATMAQPPLPSGCGAIQPGTRLKPGYSVTSCDGRFTFVLQGDGNVVLYQAGVGARWSSRTSGQDGYALWMQGDGNLVLYTRTGVPLWHTSSGGHPGAWFAMQTTATRRSTPPAARSGIPERRPRRRPPRLPPRRWTAAACAPGHR